MNGVMRIEELREQLAACYLYNKASKKFSDGYQVSKERNRTMETIILDSPLIQKTHKWKASITLFLSLVLSLFSYLPASTWTGGSLCKKEETEFSFP